MWAKKKQGYAAVLLVAHVDTGSWKGEITLSKQSAHSAAHT